MTDGIEDYVLMFGYFGELAMNFDAEHLKVDSWPVSLHFSIEKSPLKSIKLFIEIVLFNKLFTH